MNRVTRVRGGVLSDKAFGSLETPTEALGQTQAASVFNCLEEAGTSLLVPMPVSPRLLCRWLHHPGQHSKVEAAVHHWSPTLRGAGWVS